MSTSENVLEAPRRAEGERGSSLRRALRLSWLVALVWIASVAGAEVAYRIAGTPVAATMSGVYEPFGESSYKLRSGVSIFQDWVSGTFWVHTDARGFRCAAARPPAEEGSPDVLVLGDSQAFGQGVEFEDSVVGRFAAAARANGVVVANAAVGGHSFADQVALAAWLIRERGLRPRAVLFCLTPRALAYPDASAEVVVADGDLWDQPPTWPSRARKALSRNSAVYVTVRNALKRGRLAGVASDVFALYATGEARDARLAALAARLAPLRKVCDEVGAPIVFAYLPLAIEPRIDEMAASAGAAASMSAPAETLVKLGSDAAIAVIDCRPALEAVRRRGAQVTLSGDSHYGPDASREVGALLWSGADWHRLRGK